MCRGTGTARVLPGLDQTKEKELGRKCERAMVLLLPFWCPPRLFSGNLLCGEDLPSLKQMSCSVSAGQKRSILTARALLFSSSQEGNWRTEIIALAEVTARTPHTCHMSQGGDDLAPGRAAPTAPMSSVAALCGRPLC